MRRVPGWIRSLGVILLLSACLATPAAADRAAETAKAAVRSAISRAWQEHIDAAKRKDAKAVVEIYADDVIYIVPGLQDVRGRAAIDRMEATALAEADVLDAVHTTESLHVFGELAYEIGTVVGPVRSGGQQAVTVTFHFMAMWQLQLDGTLRIRSFVGQAE